jgi:hypothetical protein
MTQFLNHWLSTTYAKTLSAFDRTICGQSLPPRITERKAPTPVNTGTPIMMRIPDGLSDDLMAAVFGNAENVVAFGIDNVTFGSKLHPDKVYSYRAAPISRAAPRLHYVPI